MGSVPQTRTSKCCDSTCRTPSFQGAAIAPARGKGGRGRESERERERERERGRERGRGNDRGREGEPDSESRLCYRSTFFVLSQHPFLSFSCYRSTLASVLSQHFSRICAITALLPPCYRSTLTESVLSQHFNESVLSQHFNESVLSQHFYSASVLSQHLPFLCCRILCYRSTLLCCYRSTLLCC